MSQQVSESLEAVRINVGCGLSPTAGWINLDNSLALKLRRFPLIAKAFSKLGVIDRASLKFVLQSRNLDIRFADIRKGLNFPDASVDVVYSSHMLEHLDRNEALQFLKEIRRVLKDSGIVRIAVPDLAMKLAEWQSTQDADNFISSLHMNQVAPRSRLAALRERVVGFRGHRWMYTGASLSALLGTAGFEAVRPLAAGDTTIQEPGNLDLSERVEESLYVEARKRA